MATGNKLTRAQENTKRVNELRKQQREIGKEINALTSTTKMREHLGRWKTLSDMKQKMKAELAAHPDGKKLSWKRFSQIDDYYVYALWTQNFTYKALTKDVEWVQRELKKGTSESELIENANKMRERSWQRAEASKRRKRKSAASKEKTAAKKETEERRVSKGALPSEDAAQKGKDKAAGEMGVG